jgi:hypothetical protein
MKEACTMNLEHVIFETDAQVVFKAIHANHAGTSYSSLLINRIENLLFLNSKFEVKFVKRRANLVAHKLAKAVNSCL